jgi:hypothetical protein
VWKLAACLAFAGACRLHFDPEAVVDDGAAPGGDAPGDPCAGTLLCESFDEGFDAEYAFGDIELAAAAGRGGGGALRIRGGPGAAAFAAWTWTPAVTSGELHARVHARVMPGIPIAVFAVMLQLDNGVDTMGFEKISADLAQQDVFSVAAPFTSRSGDALVTAARDRWFCMQLAITVDAGAGGRIVLDVDGTTVYDSGPQLTMPPGGFSRLMLGATVSSSDPVFEVLYDDLAAAGAGKDC